MTSYIYNMVDTWASGGGPYTSIKMNATDNDVGSASLLMDLQVGGVSKFRVSKGSRVSLGNAGNASGEGRIVFNDFTGADGSAAIYGTYTDFLFTTANQTSYNLGHTQLTIKGVAPIAWSSNQFNTTSPADLFIGRRAAANLRLGAADAAAPVAQTLSVQSVVAGTTNTAGANLTITGSQGTGTGAGGSIIFQVAPAGSSGTAQNALATALTIGGTRKVKFHSTSGSGDIDLACIGSNIAQFEASSFPLFKVNSSAGAEIYGSYLGWNAYGQTSPDLYLYRDAANTLALRNGANAQTFRVYNTTDGTNSEFGKIAWSSNVLQIGTEKAGTGTARALEFQTDGVSRVNVATNGTARFYFNVQVDESITIGNTKSVLWSNRLALSSPADGVMRLSNWAGDGFDRLQFGGTTSSFPALKRSSTALETKLADDSAYAPHAMQYLDVTDGVTAPASATGRARIYVDTADGDLKVIFADGTVKTIVTDT